MKYIFAILLLSSTLFNTNAQISLLTGDEQKVASTNFALILNGITNFNAEAYKAEQTSDANTKIWTSKVHILPESKLLEKTTISSSDNKNYYYVESCKVDITSIVSVLKPVLLQMSFKEIEIDNNEMVLSRAFRKNNLFVIINTYLGKEIITSDIRLGDFGNALAGSKTLPFSWSPNPKGYGFVYRTNEKDTVIITKVIVNSPAAKVNLMPDDEIISIKKQKVAGLNKDSLVNLLANIEGGAAFEIKRSGKILIINLQKDWRYKFENTCLTGNCINGTGVAMSNVNDGVLYEGNFENGALVEGKWYIRAKGLTDKGHLIRKGKLMYERYFTGISYDANQPDGGYWYDVVNFDVKAKPLNYSNLNGFVKCYTNKNTGRYIWKGNFKHGKPDGEFDVYLYDKQLYWTYRVRDGVKIRHKLKRLENNNIVGDWLANDEITYNETTATWSSKWFEYKDKYGKNNFITITDLSSYQDFLTRINNYEEQSRASVKNNTQSSNQTVTNSQSCSNCVIKACAVFRLERFNLATKKNEAYNVAVEIYGLASQEVYISHRKEYEKLAGADKAKQLDFGFYPNKYADQVRVDYIKKNDLNYSAYEFERVFKYILPLESKVVTTRNKEYDDATAAVKRAEAKLDSLNRVLKPEISIDRIDLIKKSTNDIFNGKKNIEYGKEITITDILATDKYYSENKIIIGKKGKVELLVENGDGTYYGMVIIYGESDARVFYKVKIKE